MTALLSMLVLLTSSFVVSSSANDFESSKAPVQLPVEIMGVAGTIETVSVDLSAPGSVAGLWMQVHNLSYDAKGSIKINNGSWIDLTNSSVNVAYPESNIGGIGGGYSTIRITLPLNSGDVSSGANTIQFRFNGTDGLSSGWRVLKFNFVNSAGTFLLPESQFVEDDPAGWTPVLVSQDDINKGADLWYNASLIEAYKDPILAKCADCHANDGRDLKYFNYSDKSIIARSGFHGLSELEGQQIASYIRSLDVPAPGRPWNPPYQPGPGIDDKPIEEWSAGAGLEWVLDDDGETLDYLFPNGITDEVASTKSTLNMRELPLAIQFPDWNRWLPPVHPVDFWGNAFLSSNAWDSYKNGIPDALSGGVENAILKRSIENAIQGLDSDVSDFRENQSLPSGKTVQDQTQGNLGLQLWQLVKVWDVMQTYDLEGRAPDLYPDGESRSWFSIARNVFNVAPHISSAGGSTVHTHGSWMMDKYFSHAWYMYQLVINAGNRNPQGHRPMDWKYQFGHLGDYSKQTGLPSGARLVASYIKMNQMLDNDNGIGTDGWYIRHTHPYWFARSLVTDTGGPAPLMSSIPVADQARIAEVMLKAFMEKTLEFDVDDWPRGEQHEQLEPVSYRPVGYDGKGTVFEDRFNYADNFYRLIPAFAGAGVPGAALKVVADWGAAAWPNGDWANLTDYSDPGSGGGGGDGGGDGGDGGGDGGGGDGGDGGGGDGGDGGGGDGGDGGGGDGGDGGGGDGGGGGGDGGGGDPSVTYGDTTEDGSVSALDAAIVLGHLSGNITLDAAGIEAGDVNGDGVLTEDDAILILQRVLGQIDCFPVENGCAT